MIKKGTNFTRIIGGGNNLLLLLLLILLVFYNLSFFGGDLLVSFASAHQASLIEGNFFEQLIQSWNLRGFGYKLIIYFNYQIINPLVNMFESPKAFNHLFRGLHSVFFLLTLFAGKILLKGKLKELGIKTNLLILASGIIFFSASFLMVGQPEEYAFIFTVWYLIFGLSNHKVLNWLSGVFVIIIFSLKVTTIGFLVFPATVFLYHRKKVNFNTLLISGAAGILLTAIIYFTILQPDLKDVLEASLFQKSGILKLYFLKRMLNNFGYLFYFQPYLFLGVIATFLIPIKPSNNKERFIFLFALIIGFLVIFLQSKFFPYHFIILYPIGILGWITISRFKTVFYSSLIVALILFGLVNNQTLELNYKKALPASGAYNYAYNYEFRKEIANGIKSIIKNPNEQVLFLTEGGINYFLPNPSYRRYFYPLPLQRVALNPSLKEREVYQNTLQSFLNYKGAYIVWQPDWFNLALHPKLQNFINTEFVEVYNYNNYQKMKLLQRK